MGQVAKIFLIAGNRLLRDALARHLNRQGDMEVVDATTLSTDALPLLFSSAYEVLLIDWPSSNPDILDTICELRESFGQRKTILIGVRAESESFLQAVRAGVAGVLLEDASAADVAQAVRAVMRHEAVCPAVFVKYLFDQVFVQARKLPSARIRVRLGLTRREQQLVPLIARGLTNKEIAFRLNLSEQTVKNHVHRMLQKAGVSDRLEVVEACDDATVASVSAPPHWP